MLPTFLDELLVVELGERPGVAACGSLLAELGATVVLVERLGTPRRADSKMAHRASIAAGKRSLGVDLDCRADVELLVRLIGNADVLLTSSDFGEHWPEELKQSIPHVPVICDLTACGSTGPLAGVPYSDALMQALGGLADTTGSPAGAPVLCRVPILEFTAGTYAAAGIVAALRARRLWGVAQRVEVALFDVAMSTLTTFLPAHYVGGQPQRVGNRHPGIAPWNAYRTLDGWVLICTSSDDQWIRICELIGKPELAADPRYLIPTARVRNVDELDTHIEDWTTRHTTADCIQGLTKANISCGPVYALPDLFEDPNVVYRAAVVAVKDAESGATVRVPGMMFRGSVARSRPSGSVPKRDQDRRLIEDLAAGHRCFAAARGEASRSAPLEGLRVLELGQYTTAPLAARQLGALGADVVKIEGAAGDSARALPPQQNGQSYFFTMGNSDKRSIVIDLRSEHGKQRFGKLLAKADVLVENMRPGALSGMGFTLDEIMRINRRVIYCTISGFGHDSAYIGRPAMDTTIQGMSGLMDMTRSGDVPYKTGISLADIAGGQFGLLGILAALEFRDRTNRGQHIDLSMQDIALWYTRFSWNEPSQVNKTPTLCRCDERYVAVDPDGKPDGIGHAVLRNSAAAEVLSSLGPAYAPVMTVGEVADHPHSIARGLIVAGRSSMNVDWPLLASPIRLSHSIVQVKRAISPIGADEAEVLRDWGIGREELPA